MKWKRTKGPQVVFTAQEAVNALARTYPERFKNAGFGPHHKIEWTMDNDGIIMIEVQS